MSKGLTLPGAALTTGCAMLLQTLTAPFAQFYVLERLIFPGDMERTVHNIVEHHTLFAAGLVALLVNYVLDIVIAWSLYVLLAAVNRQMSLLAAWFSLVYTALGMVSALNLATVFRLLTTPDYAIAFGARPLEAQAKLLLNTFRSDWSLGLIFFAIHLGLVGYLIWRSGFIPRIIGVLLIMNGLAWIVDGLEPYLYPNVNLPFLSIAYLGELVLMGWLLIRGSKIQEDPTGKP